MHSEKINNYKFQYTNYDSFLALLKSKDITITKKAVFYIQDNTGELGEGAVYRKGERESLYKAFDMGSWWLQDALES